MFIPEILQCIHLVKIFIFLDLAKTISFLDGHEIFVGRSGSGILQPTIAYKDYQQSCHPGLRPISRRR